MLHETRSDIDAERGVLGAALLDAATIPACAGVVRDTDFADPRHASIWACMISLFEGQQPVDPLTISAELKARGRFEACGGLIYLVELTELIPTCAHAPRHARIVADHARARRIAFAARKLLASCSDTALSPEALEALAVESLREANSGAVSSAPKRLRAVLDEALEATFASQRGEHVVAPTGLRVLDRMLGGGFRPGQLVVLAARPAMGKSSLAWQIAEAAAARGTVPYVSIEMPGVELGQRLLAARARVSLSRLRDGSCSNEELERVCLEHDRAHDLPVEVHDHVDEATTVAKVRAILASARAKGPVPLLVIDYLQLMDCDGGRDESREREVARTTKALKKLARAAGTPILLLAQLNRGPEARADKRPQLSDLRESGAIEQDADIVVFIYRDEIYNRDTEDRGIAELIVAKQRNGPTDTVRLRFVRELTRFEDETVFERGATANDDAEPEVRDGAA